MQQQMETTEIPGPPSLPVLGNILQFRGKGILEAYLDLWQEYGDIFHMKLGRRESYVLANPDHVNHVLVKNQKNYIKGVGYDGFRLLVGQGLVTSDGELWRQQRRLMSPPFTPKAVTQFMEMMVDATNKLLDRWQAAADAGEALHMDVEMMRLTTSVIGQALFGIDLDEELTEVGEAFQSAFGFIPERSTSVLPLSLPLPKHHRFQENLALIESFVNEQIEVGRRDDRQDTLLSMLLAAQDEETGQGMSDEQLRDEVVTLFFAGFETTARSLTWAWYLLSKHPDVLARLTAESEQVLNGRSPEVADLYELTYTRMVVDETLRLYPPTALLARQNLEDDVIGGYTIPANSMIILFPLLIHRYPGVWEDPEQFDPDRFLPEAVEQRPKQAYIPFANGPRICLGNNFALLEMVLALSMAAGRFDFEAVSDETIDYEFAGALRRPVKPLYLKVKNR